MKTCFCHKPNTYRDTASAMLHDARGYAVSGYTVAHSYLSALLNRFILSEIFVLKMMLISLGILIGTMFSDFFKKHRTAVIVVFFVSLALFMYKVFQLVAELDDSSEPF